MRVNIAPKRGRTSVVELRVTETIAPGQVLMPFHFAETDAKKVTQSAVDPILREPNYRQCALLVEKTLLSPGAGTGTKFLRPRGSSVQERA